MVKAVCINKFRDKNGIIIGYSIRDAAGNIKEVEAAVLKKAIKSNRVQVVNLTLTSDNRLVNTSEKRQDQDKQINKGMTKTKQLYMQIQSNTRLALLEDYKFNMSYSDSDNRLHIKYKFCPSYGTDLTQNFFGNDDAEIELVITDRNNVYYVYSVTSNRMLLTTSDMLLVLNVLNITDKNIKKVETLEKSMEFLQGSFSSLCGSMEYINFTAQLRGKGNPEFDSDISKNLLKACFMELKYRALSRNPDLDVVYNSYLLRGQKGLGYEGIDGSFKSTTTSMEIATTYGRDGVILALKNVKLRDIINVQKVVTYDKDFIFYEHELLLRDYSKVTIGEQIGVLNGIPVYLATVEMPECKSRVSNIINAYTKVYGNNNQFYLIHHIIKYLSKIYEITSDFYGATIEGENGKISIEFDRDKNTVFLDGEDYTDRQTIIELYDSIIGVVE